MGKKIVVSFLGIQGVGRYAMKTFSFSMRGKRRRGICDPDFHTEFPTHVTRSLHYSTAKNMETNKKRRWKGRSHSIIKKKHFRSSDAHTMIPEFGSISLEEEPECQHPLSFTPPRVCAAVLIETMVPGQVCVCVQVCVQCGYG